MDILNYQIGGVVVGGVDGTASSTLVPLLWTTMSRESSAMRASSSLPKPPQMLLMFVAAR